MNYIYLWFDNGFDYREALELLKQEGVFYIDGAPSPYNDGRYAIKMDMPSDADEASIVLNYAGIPFELVDTYRGY